MEAEVRVIRLRPGNAPETSLANCTGGLGGAMTGGKGDRQAEATRAWAGGLGESVSHSPRRNRPGWHLALGPPASSWQRLHRRRLNHGARGAV